jgi:hypothetical protein
MVAEWLRAGISALVSQMDLGYKRPFLFTKRRCLEMAKKSKRRTWTTADVRILKAAAKKKTRATSIARSLKRTEGATRQKAFSLGLSLDSR